MSLEALSKAISSFSPILGSAILGPVGGIVGSLISTVFGGNSGDPKDLAQRIQSDPDAAVKLRALELQHQKEIAQINAQNYANEVDDRKDARKRQLDMHDHVPAIIACTFVLIYAGIQYFVIKNPDSQLDIISARIQDIMIMIVGYYFGSAYKRKQGNK